MLENNLERQNHNELGNICFPKFTSHKELVRKLSHNKSGLFNHFPPFH
jgi:hypothetical protein